MKLKIISTCLNCDNEIPMKESINGKMICSMKCLREIVETCEDYNGIGTCGYDKSDVAKSYIKIKKG